MKNILVIGSTGQIGSELTMELRKRYGNDHVVAGYIHGAEPKGELLESGPSALADVTDGEMLSEVARKYDIDSIYNLAALLSVVAESKPRLAWKIGIDGLWNVLEVARERHCAVFTPSSIGSFGRETPHMMTPQDTIQRPRTIYGISKVTTFSRHHFLQDPSRRGHHRLRRRYILQCRARRTFRLSAEGRHDARHDVHARCAACRHHADGSQSR